MKTFEVVVLMTQYPMYLGASFGIHVCVTVLFILRLRVSDLGIACHIIKSD